MVSTVVAFSPATAITLAERRQPQPMPALPPIIPPQQALQQGYKSDSNKRIAIRHASRSLRVQVVCVYSDPAKAAIQLRVESAIFARLVAEVSTRSC